MSAIGRVLFKATHAALASRWSYVLYTAQLLREQINQQLVVFQFQKR